MSDSGSSKSSRGSSRGKRRDWRGVGDGGAGFGFGWDGGGRGRRRRREEGVERSSSTKATAVRRAMLPRAFLIEPHPLGKAKAKQTAASLLGQQSPPRDGKEPKQHGQRRVMHRLHRSNPLAAFFLYRYVSFKQRPRSSPSSNIKIRGRVCTCVCDLHARKNKHFPPSTPLSLRHHQSNITDLSTKTPHKQKTIHHITPAAHP